MKTVTFTKPFRNRLSNTAYQEWPAGAEDIVSDEVAAKAKAAGALNGEPVDAPAVKPAPKAKA